MFMYNKITKSWSTLDTTTVLKNNFIHIIKHWYYLIVNFTIESILCFLLEYTKEIV